MFELWFRPEKDLDFRQLFKAEAMNQQVGSLLSEPVGTTKITVSDNDHGKAMSCQQVKTPAVDQQPNSIFKDINAFEEDGFDSRVHKDQADIISSDTVLAKADTFPDITFYNQFNGFPPNPYSTTMDTFDTSGFNNLFAYTPTPMAAFLPGSNFREPEWPVFGAEDNSHLQSQIATAGRLPPFQAYVISEDEDEPSKAGSSYCLLNTRLPQESVRNEQNASHKRKAISDMAMGEDDAGNHDNSHRYKEHRRAAQTNVHGDISALYEPFGAHSKSKKSNSSKSANPSKRTASGRKRGLKQREDVFSNLRQSKLADLNTTNQKHPETLTFQPTTRRNQAIQELFKNARDKGRSLDYTQKDFKKACHAFGLRQIRTEGNNGRYQVRGMKQESALTHHQLFGVQFMINREQPSESPRGGIQADEMGLGKTVMMIALIVNAKMTNRQEGPTLIVCPTNIARQWQSEFAKHCENGALNLVALLSIAKALGHNDVSFLRACNVVIATYHDVIASWPSENDFKEDTEPNPLKRGQMWEERKGPLHRISWGRIVLDESHNINNHQTRTSEACRALNGAIKWLMSGTPVLNRPDEFFSYFNFLGIEYSEDRHVFMNRYIRSSGVDNVVHLKAALTRLMIRRHRDETILGEPILKLPGLSIETKLLTFSNFERTAYNKILAMISKGLNLTHKADSKLKKAFGMVCNFLRQFTAHFLLVSRRFSYLEVEDLEEFLDLTYNKGGMNAQSLKELLEELDENFPEIKMTGDEEEEDEELEDLWNVDDNNSISTKLPHPFDDPKHAKLDAMRNKFDISKKQLTSCGICNEEPRNPHITNCGHVHCSGCLKNAMQNLQDDYEGANCGHCQNPITDSTAFTKLSQENPALKAFITQEMKPKQLNFLPHVRARLKGLYNKDVLPTSTKVTGVMKQLQKWIYDDPEQKIIVFTQYRGMINLLEHELQQRKLGYCTYHGQHSGEARLKATEKFQNDDEKKILLMSLRAGGTGLNLTMASRVILVDLWFNSSVEMQAFCRVIRMGQTRPVQIIRFIVRSSVDDRLAKMQEDKQRRLENFVEADGINPNNYTNEEMSYILAPNVADAPDIIQSGLQDVSLDETST